MASRGIHIGLGFGFVLAFGLTVLAAPEEPADLKAKVLRLVEQLAVPAKQVAAETELLKLGPDILPYLPDDKAKLTPAQKEKLQSIRATLYEAKVLRELAPRTVTLQNKSIPLSHALEQLRKQTEIEIVDRREMRMDDPELKLDLARVPFWQALDAIAREADLRVSLYDREGKIALMDGPHKAQPVSYSGMFRIMVKRITIVHDLESEARYCQINLQVAWEPRFHPLFMQNKPDNLICKDDKGNSLTEPDTGAGRNPMIGRLFTEVQVTTEAPRRSINSLSLLKGTLSAIGPGKMLEFSFDKMVKTDRQTPMDKVVTKTQEGVTVRLREFNMETDLWTVGFLLEYPPGGPDFESFESWLVNNKAFLEDKEGKRYTDSGYEIEEQGGNKALATYRFAEENELVLGKPEQWKLIYRTPGMMAKVPIHFEFKDVLLP